MTASLTVTYGAVNLCSSPYLVEFGADLGAPQNEANPLAFLLQDGEIELSSRASNRTLQFNVLIEGASLTALATAEAALIAESEKVLNTITVDPGDGAPVAVFDVYRGQVTLVRDDAWEIARMRRYTVTVRALPFARSATEVVAPALAASGTTTTLVDDGSATTGWTGTINGTAGTVVVSSGAVGLSSSALALGVTMALTRTGSITTSSTKYLMVDWRGMADFPLSATGDGVALERVSQTNSPTAGYTRTWFYVPAASVASLTLTQASYWPTGTVVRPLYVDNINRTDIRPSLGSARQLLRTIAVQGSARTPGRLAIEHETTALGWVIVYTWSGGTEGYSPPLRPYRVSGGSVTTDATKLSGAYEPIKSTTITYDIPISRVTPGLHLLMLQLVTTSSLIGSVTTLTYTSQTRIGTTTISAVDTGTVTVPSTSINGPANVGLAVIGRLALPTVATDPNSGAMQRITLNATTTLADLSIDEGWLFHADGRLVNVYVQTGTPSLGGPSNRLWVEPPSVATPRPVVKIGMNADRSDAHSPYPGNLVAWEQPEFIPDRVNVFTVTTGTTDANATLSYFPRWHTNPGS